MVLIINKCPVLYSVKVLVSAISFLVSNYCTNSNFIQFSKLSTVTEVQFYTFYNLPLCFSPC